MFRNALIVILILGVFLPEPARAEIAGANRCGPLFGGLLSRVKSQISHTAFKKQLEEIEAIPVKDIFPGSFVRRGKTLVKVNEATKLEYQNVFDRLWENRYKSGAIPRGEVAAYRSWLKKKYGKAYPPIEAEVLYNNFVIADPSGSIVGYFDDHFLDYLYESKRVTAESIDDYIKSIDPSLVRRWGKRAMSIMAKTRDYVITAAITASLMQFYTIPGDLVSGAINGLSQAFFGATLKEFLNGKTKEVTESVGETVRDWNLFAGGEEKYVSTLFMLKTASQKLKAKNFDNMTRSKALESMEEFKAITSAKLPLFRDLLLSEQKEFETIWDNRLQELKQSTVAVNSNYHQYKIALDNIKAGIDIRDLNVPTTQELELMARYSQEMAGAETFLANTLADWLFYKQARGENNPIDPALDLNFTMVYNSYMRSMSPSLLASAINARVIGHVSQLEKYSKKAAGKRQVELESPDKKPELQILEGSEEILRPAPSP